MGFPFADHYSCPVRVSLCQGLTAVFRSVLTRLRGVCSSVGIATDYGLDGPGSNPGGDEIFRPSRPALLYSGYRIYPGGKVRPGRAADHSPPSSAAVMEE